MNRKSKTIDEPVRLVIKNEISELSILIAKVDELKAKWSIPAKAAREIHLALEELVTNIIFYAYDDEEEHSIEIEFNITPKGIMIRTEDDGKAFDLLHQSDPVNTSRSIEERPVGGLGIHFIKTIMDKIEYERKGNKNRLTITKNFK